MSRERREDISKRILETSRQTQKLKQELEALIASGIRGKSAVTLHSDQHLPTVPSTSQISTYRDLQALTTGPSHTQIIKSYDLKYSDRTNKAPHKAKSTENLIGQEQAEIVGAKRKPYDQHEAREFIKKQKAKRKEELKKKSSNQLENELRKEKLQKLQERARELVKRNVQGRTGARTRTKSAEPQIQKFREASRSLSRERKNQNPSISPRVSNGVRRPLDPNFLCPPKQVYGIRQMELSQGLINVNIPTKKSDKPKDIPMETKERRAEIAVPIKMDIDNSHTQVHHNDRNLNNELSGATSNTGKTQVSQQVNSQKCDMNSKPVPEWLKEQPPTDPCNFINTVKRRLLNERKPYHVDVGVQGNLEAPNVVLIPETEQQSRGYSSNKTDLKSFISHKGLNLNPRSLQQVDRHFISVKDGPTITEDSSSGNEYDTSRNIPSISTESGTSIRRNVRPGEFYDKKVCDLIENGNVPPSLDVKKVQDIRLRNPESISNKLSGDLKTQSLADFDKIISGAESRGNSKTIDTVPTYTQLSSNLNTRSSKGIHSLCTTSDGRSSGKSKTLLTVPSDARSDASNKSKRSHIDNTSNPESTRNSDDNILSSNLSTLNSDLKKSRDSIISFNCAKVSPNKVPVFLPQSSQENVVNEKTSSSSSEVQKSRKSEKKRKIETNKSQLARNITTRSTSNNSIPDSEPILTEVYSDKFTKSAPSGASDKDYQTLLSTLWPSSEQSDGSERKPAKKLSNTSIQTESVKTVDNPSLQSEKTTASSKSLNVPKASTEEISQTDKSKPTNKAKNSKMSLIIHRKDKGDDFNSNDNKEVLFRNITLRSGDDRNSLKDPQEIHLKFEAEIHLITDFKESIRRLSQIEETFESLRHNRGTKLPVEENVQYEKGTQTSVPNTPTTNSKSQKINTLQDKGTAQINTISEGNTESHLLSLSQFSFHTDFNSENSAMKLDDSFANSISDNNTGPLSVSQINPENSLREKGGFSTGVGDEHVVVKNIAGVSLRMFDQLLNDEDARIDNWKVLLKIREQFLLDRTKGELVWLEMQRKQLIETGKLSEASLIKKKQRGILLKHQQEKMEMQRLKQMQKEDSQKRKTILKREKDLIKSQLMSVNMLSGLRPCTPKEKRERRLSGPLRVIQTSGTTLRSETSISKSTVGTDEEIKSITTHTSKTHSMVNIISEHSDSTITDLELPELPGIGSDQEVIGNNTISNLKKTLLMREQALAKRKKTVEELLQWHKKLQDEEKAIADLETKIVTITSKIPSELRHRPPRRSKSLGTLSVISNEIEDVHSMPQLTHETLQQSISVDNSKKSIKESSEISQTNILTEDNSPALEESNKAVSSANYTADFDIETAATVSEEQNSVSSISQLIEDFSKIKDNILNLNSVSTKESASIKSELALEEPIKAVVHKENEDSPISKAGVDEIVAEELNDTIAVSNELEHQIDAESNTNTEPELLSDALVYVVEEPCSSISESKEKIASAVEIEEIPSIEDNENDQISVIEISSDTEFTVQHDSIAEPNIQVSTSSNVQSVEPSASEEHDISETSDVHLSIASNRISDGPHDITAEPEATEIHSFEPVESLSTENVAEESFEQIDDSASTVLSIQNRIPEGTSVGVSNNSQNSTTLDQDDAIQSMENKTDEEKAALRSVENIPNASVESLSSISSDIPAIESQRSASTSSPESVQRDFSIPKPCSSVSVERRIPEMAAVERSVDQVVSETSQSLDDKRPFLLGSEAEELHRKQLAIEQEIKFLKEQQQKEAAAPFYIREIPNKPPPPYTPPSKTKPPKSSTIIPSSKEEVEQITEYSAKILYNAYRSKNLEKINISENTLNLIAKNIDKSCYKYVFDLCKEIAQEYYSQFSTNGPSWLQVDAKPAQAHINTPDVEALKKFLNSKLLILFEFEKAATKRENAITKWSKKKRDHVDEPLLQQLLAEEPTWTNFDYDEARLKDRLTNEIMDILLKDCAQAVKKALVKKFECE
ncbi:centrosome-associated protein 350-like isoform X2 [Anthonomus grandis grandis]|uniref:centrosome-associated protein 350-like isoform X2 n=1 Tax=Anthonomus grandis grandis TaxID=2921223 RepID=UPI0021658E3C|nr:centrosome-associated protein 350-like isoform X2 [Anthonomus grandis grandis]